MKKTIVLFSILIGLSISYGQKKTEKFTNFSFGTITPTGWLKIQMQKDIEGFVGNLDQLVPDLINDPIYSKGRLHKQSKVKDLGNLKEGDLEGDEQYKWWNSETQSNWWDGYIRNVYLLNDKKGIAKVKQYVNTICATQDKDGYLGIYDTELRYNFNSENGELWSKATLYRGLLAYYECTQDQSVFDVLIKAVNNVMHNYPIHQSSPFNSGNSFNAGVSHGLTFTDVLERLYFHTRNQKYRDYALFLYTDFSNTHQSESDAQLKNILNPSYALKSHGVHTFEHVRPLIVATYASATDELAVALQRYLERIEGVTTITGGAIGDEWIGGRKADATHTGYEYCSLQELLDSYCMLYQKTGNANIGDKIETIFYNAAQGARHPEHSCIAYLKTDNSYEMMGTKNGEIEPNRNQTRFKYSPVHQDVAVCCSPNAGRISPYFIQNSWMKENDSTLVASLLVPNKLVTELNNTTIEIENITNYPYENTFQFKFKLSHPKNLILKIRKPKWVQKIHTNEVYKEIGDFICIERVFSTTDNVTLSFDTEVELKTDPQDKYYFTYGALVYALPIESKEHIGKAYKPKFVDYTYKSISINNYRFLNKTKPSFSNGNIKVTLQNTSTNELKEVTLIPIGKTILRQVTF